MARTVSFVEWSAANSLTVSANTAVTSDAFSLATGTRKVAIQLSADNAGTPAAGDTATFKILWGIGDILEDTGIDYDTEEHGEYLVTLDTVAANTPGEDPARRTVLVQGAASFKISCTCPQAATRNIVIRALVEEDDLLL